jgi:putative endonuclease
MHADSNYCVYILTNKHKNVLYVGATNNLPRRLFEHAIEKAKKTSFTFRYNCDYLIYYEHQVGREAAFAREKEIKKWRREKKNNLIKSFNPKWKFLNEKVIG